MDASGLITAICRVTAVLAVAGVLAMHGVTSGHHAELPAAGGASSHVSAMAHSVLGAPLIGDRSTGDAVMTTAPRGSLSPEGLVGVCMAVLLVAATTLLLLLARARRRRRPTDMTSALARWALHVPDPRPPSLFTLGVLRA